MKANIEDLLGSVKRGKVDELAKEVEGESY